MAGDSPSIQDAEGCTPLHYAALRGNAALFHLLHTRLTTPLTELTYPGGEPNTSAAGTSSSSSAAAASGAKGEAKAAAPASTAPPKSAKKAAKAKAASAKEAQAKADSSTGSMAVGEAPTSKVHPAALLLHYAIQGGSPHIIRTLLADGGFPPTHYLMLPLSVCLSVISGASRTLSHQTLSTTTKKAQARA